MSAANDSIMSSVFIVAAKTIKACIHSSHIDDLSMTHFVQLPRASDCFDDDHLFSNYINSVHKKNKHMLGDTY